MREVAEIKEHSEYDPVTQVNDIALLRLKDEVNYKKEILPICMPPSTMTDPEGLWVAGWGRNEQGGQTNDELNEIRLPKVSNEECSEKFKGLINEKHICAGGNGGQDACQGRVNVDRHKIRASCPTANELSSITLAANNYRLICLFI